jgi:predicted glycoside hydrolase/deacetylase ChbG (UPF0249 family)
MKYLIINADDFGLTPEVSQGILKAARDGVLTSTTVMINSPHRGEFSELLDTEIGIGLHFNLTWGSPVSLPEEVPSLVNKDGYFQSDPDIGKRKSTDIEKELEAQIALFLQSIQRTPSHIDVHKHLHKYFIVLEAVIAVARRLEIPVRFTTAEMKTILRENNVTTPDFFMGDAKPEKPYWTKDQLLSSLISIQPGVTEIMCHPGYVPTSIPGMFYNQQREVELESFCDPDVWEEINRQEIGLINFSYLKRGA